MVPCKSLNDITDLAKCILAIFSVVRLVGMELRVDWSIVVINILKE